MDSGRRRGAAVDWAGGLTTDLLAIISGGLGNRIEIVRFRSVCKSWRLSTPAPPNKLSPLFPLRFPPRGEPSRRKDLVVSASAVYLVRPRSDPSKSWMVGLNEPAVGSLVLRHAVSYMELDGGSDPDLVVDGIAATQTLINTSYSHTLRHLACDGIEGCYKVVFVCEPDYELVGLSFYPRGPVAFRVSSSGAGKTVVLGGGATNLFYDFLSLKGRIYAVDAAGLIYVLDTTNLELVRVTHKPIMELGAAAVVWLNLVVSDGELYVVWLRYDILLLQVYKLVLVQEESGECKCSGILVQVKDLGDRVFFLSYKCSYSVSARLLPPPWKGNCVFIPNNATYNNCRCDEQVDYNLPHHLYNLEDQSFTTIRDGYLDLFSPPHVSLVHA